MKFSLSDGSWYLVGCPFCHPNSAGEHEKGCPHVHYSLYRENQSREYYYSITGG